MVVNDGSKDDTLQKLKDAYDLVKVETVMDPDWKSKPVNAIYKSKNMALFIGSNQSITFKGVKINL